MYTPPRKSPMKRVLDELSRSLEATGDEKTLEPSQAKRAKQGTHDKHGVCPLTKEIVPLASDGYTAAMFVLRSPSSEIMLRAHSLSGDIMFVLVRPDPYDAGTNPLPFAARPERVCRVEFRMSNNKDGNVVITSTVHVSVAWVADKSVIESLKWPVGTFVSATMIELPAVRLDGNPIDRYLKWKELIACDDDQVLISERVNSLPGYEQLCSLLGVVLAFVPMDVIRSVVVPYCLWRECGTCAITATCMYV